MKKTNKIKDHVLISRMSCVTEIMLVLGLVLTKFIKKPIKNYSVNSLIHIRILTDLLLTPYSVCTFNTRPIPIPLISSI